MLSVLCLGVTPHPISTRVSTSCSGTDFPLCIWDSPAVVGWGMRTVSSCSLQGSIDKDPNKTSLLGQNQDAVAAEGGGAKVLRGQIVK